MIIKFEHPENSVHALVKLYKSIMQLPDRLLEK